jgi:hypothetical protein
MPSSLDVQEMNRKVVTIHAIAHQPSCHIFNLQISLVDSDKIWYWWPIFAVVKCISVAYKTWFV